MKLYVRGAVGRRPRISLVGYQRVGPGCLALVGWALLAAVALWLVGGLR